MVHLKPPVMLLVICKVNNEMAQGLKEYNGILLCPLKDTFCLVYGFSCSSN